VKVLKLTLACLFASFVAWIPFAAAAKEHPIAAAKPQNGSLFLLTHEGIVLAVNLDATKGSVVARFDCKLVGFPSDLAVGMIGSQEALFVASSWSTSVGMVQGRVQAFTTDGRLLQTWTLAHVIAGLAFDPEKQLLYITTGDTPEVYSITVQSDASPRDVGEITGASKLGAIAVDGSRQQLYVADVDRGSVFSMDLGTSQVGPAGRVGTPQALLLDPGRTELLVADSSRGQILAIKLNSQGFQSVPITPPKAFRSPTGLAWFGSSQLLVADDDAGTVTLLDAAGHAQLKIPLE